MEELITFKVNPGLYNYFPNSKKHYYKVLVFDSKESMWLAWKNASDSSEKYHNGDFEALTISYYGYREERESMIVKPKIGNVLFCKDYLDFRILSHEAVHMSTNFLRILNRLSLSERVDDDEENLAYCIGSCTKQIVDKFYKFKVF